MDSRGKVFADGELAPQATLFNAYEKLVAHGFVDLDRFSLSELQWLIAIHDKHLRFYMEERRMHFGAFALVSLALVILLPAVLTLEDYFLPLAIVEALLLVLLAPYTFVYRRYEEGVRRKMKQSLLLENAHRRKKESCPAET